MVRNYQRKNKKRTYSSCNNDDPQKAIDAVKSKQMTLRKALEAFNVKKSTLHDHIKEKQKTRYIFLTLFKIRDKFYPEIY